MNALMGRWVWKWARVRLCPLGCAVSEGRQLIEREGPGLMEEWATSSVGVGHCWPVLPWASGAIDACAKEGTGE